MNLRTRTAGWVSGWAGVLMMLASSGGDAAAGPHRVRIEGAGTATVVFEAGLGDTLEVWRGVQAPVARSCARTFSYNRAGYSGSPHVHGARDAVAIVDELRAELAERGLPPPYVLVGHSLGGLYLQYYARRYPGEVRGLVLVDATHWDHLARMRAEAPASYRMVRVASLLMPGIMRREMADSERAGEEVRALAPVTSVPTIVLSSTEASPGDTPAFRHLQRRLQTEIADAWRASRHEFVPGSRHYIQRERPEAVIRALRELTGCGR